MGNKDVFVYLEQHDGKLLDVGLEMLGPARQMAGAMAEAPAPYSSEARLPGRA